MKTIEIIVSPAGEVRLETKGFQGSACRDASRFLERALGNTTGERLTTKYEFAPLLEKQGAAILQPALGRVGGILEAKKIAGMAEAHYAQIAPHLYCGPIEAAANIQLGTCSPNFLIQESIERFDGFYARILKRPIQWQDGYIIPPTEPGLGVELDEDFATEHPYEGTLFPEMVEHPL